MKKKYLIVIFIIMAILLLREAVKESLIIKEIKDSVNINYDETGIEKDVYVIEIDKFNIFNDNTEAEKTTRGINDALTYAKEQGYSKVKLPGGHYSIDTSVINPIIIKDNDPGWTSESGWIHYRKGISLLSDLEFDITGCVLEMIPTEDADYSILTISGCNNTKVIGGTILGDRENHDYGMRINNSGNEFEVGGIESNTGDLTTDTSQVRTKDFITNFIANDGSIEPLLMSFYMTPVYNTTFNTVDGGRVFISCYDDKENFLGQLTHFYADGIVNLPQGTKKIKLSFWNERRLDAVYAITKRDYHYTYEYGTGITIANSNNIEINGTVIKDTIGDCIGTSAPPLKVTVDNLKIIDCTLENARRQGISLVATGENYLIQGCNIGKINGVDPQSGIDIEHYDYVKNVVIDDSNFYDNKKWDIINYNGWDIEIKNSKFNGGIASTYGYNMDIHNNEFKYNDETWLDKTFKGTLFSLNTDKTDEDGVYFNIYNNNIEGYTASGGNYTSGLSKSEFRNNRVKNSNMAIGANGYGNTYTDSDVRYVLLDYEYKNEKFENCLIGGENNGDGTKIRYYTNFEMINCEFGSGTPTVKDTVLTNCKIYNNDKTFCKTWSGKYTLNNCDIKTEYETDISFIESQGVKATFNECDLDLAATPFIALNYGDFIMKNCNVKFNDSYKGKSEEIDFFTNVYGTSNFENNSFDTSSINTTIILPN